MSCSPGGEPELKHLNTSYLLLQLYRYTKSECCIFIRTTNAVEFEIYWDKTATGLMYQLY